MNTGHTMSLSLTTNDVSLRGNSLTLYLILEDKVQRASFVGSNTSSSTSPEYLINTLVAFQVKVVKTENNTYLYFVRFIVKRNINQLTYTVNYSHSYSCGCYKHRLEYSRPVEQQLCIKNEQWQLMSELAYNSYYNNKISVKLSVSTSVNPFERIQNNINLIDFQLRGEDGSVTFHELVAASFSPVLKTSLRRRDGRRVIDAPSGTTRQTLQHLKDYMYSDKMPEDGLKELLLLASYYRMPDLELRCVLDMFTNVTLKEANELLQFGMKHEISRIISEFMHRYGQNDNIDNNNNKALDNSCKVQ